MMQEKVAVEKIQKSYRFVDLIFGTHNIYKFAEQFNPDFVVRQVSTGATPEAYAQMVARYHAPIIFPSHHDSHHLDKAQNMSFDEYFTRVNKTLAEMDAKTQVINIDPYKWYNIGIQCEEA